eukprot:snap_masked-scaffold_6-processed-gene-14.7-mRNA-1 protein AED:1.00 eAED:1.00 QI:0/-1/0/0/-1/1/1/0/319
MSSFQQIQGKKHGYVIRKLKDREVEIRGSNEKKMVLGYKLNKEKYINSLTIGEINNPITKLGLEQLEKAFKQISIYKISFENINIENEALSNLLSCTLNCAKKVVYISIQINKNKEKQLPIYLNSVNRCLKYQSLKLIQEKSKSENIFSTPCFIPNALSKISLAISPNLLFRSWMKKESIYSLKRIESLHLEESSNQNVTAFLFSLRESKLFLNLKKIVLNKFVKSISPGIIYSITKVFLLMNNKCVLYLNTGKANEQSKCLLLNLLVFCPMKPAFKSTIYFNSLTGKQSSVQRRLEIISRKFLPKWKPLPQQGIYMSS